MNNSEENSVMRYFRLIQPQSLVWILLTFSIGVGLVHHQGGDLDWLNIFLGGVLLLILELFRVFLSAFFDHPLSPTSELSKEHPTYRRLIGMERQTLLVVALTLLTASAVDVVLLIVRNIMSLQFGLILVIAFLLNFFFSVPPLKLERRGYGEIVEALLICNISPAIGFLLNQPDLHVLLIMLNLPLTLLYLAYQLVISLETYAFDLGHRVPSLVIRLDWNRAMLLHNYLVLTSFLLIGVFTILGQPWSLTWPMFMPLLVGVFQIIQILRIMSGAPPRWKIVKLTAAATFVIMAYLVSFTLWIS